MADHKDSPEVTRLEVIDTGHRRRWTEDEKLRIVMESLSGPRLGLETARRYGIARSLLSTWRRRFRVEVAGASRFVPAVVVPERVAAPSASSRMEIVADLSPKNSASLR